MATLLFRDVYRIASNQMHTVSWGGKGATKEPKGREKKDRRCNSPFFLLVTDCGEGQGLFFFCPERSPRQQSTRFRSCSSSPSFFVIFFLFFSLPVLVKGKEEKKKDKAS